MTDQTTAIPKRITVNRDQLAALLAHHADVLAARWRAVAPGAGAWEVAAALSLTSHADELTDEAERPSVTKLLDSMMSFRAAAAARQAGGQQPDTTTPARACVECELGTTHTVHCPSPETHNWGCGCPTDEKPRCPRCAPATDKARARIENLWDRATPVGPLLDDLVAAVRREDADWLHSIGEREAAHQLRRLAAGEAR
ncbi:hypothetical protein [Streptomyces cinereoruber]|uniref:hypothetical protein n=1 Tax=Streptomyces cinereoruber TaxID=67260 RepID=UPI0033914612